MIRTVFVSSTFVDLQTHRKAVWDTLNTFDVTVRGMEQFGARTETPLQTCLLEVDQSDIYVGIIAFRLGSIETESGKSYTQLEYERAVALSKDIFIYIIDEINAKVSIGCVDHGNSWDKLVALKSILRERHTVDTFVDEADLKSKLKRDLERHLSPRQAQPIQGNIYADSKATLEQFLLLPKSLAGTEVRLKLRATGTPFPASSAVCQAFNFEFGATLGISTEILIPDGVAAKDQLELYIDSKQALGLLSIGKGDVLDAYVKMHFSSRDISQLRAQFQPKIEYPDSPFERMGMGSIMGKPKHYPADSRLALELSRLEQHQRVNRDTV